jgi:hypothetical protein
MSPMMGDLDDIFSFGRQCGDESGGIESVVNVYILCCFLLFFIIKVYNNINEFDFLLLFYEIYKTIFSVLRNMRGH